LTSIQSRKAGTSPGVTPSGPIAMWPRAWTTPAVFPPPWWRRCP